MSLKDRMRLSVAAIAGALLLAGPSVAQAPLRGEGLYKKGLCAVCHGEDRKGTKNAPALLDLKRHWKADALADYLADPAKARAEDPRLAELAKRYPTLVMPPWKATESERRILAEWLLAD